jgi:hypothetical protein
VTAVDSVYCRKNSDSKAIRDGAASSPSTKKGKYTLAQTIAANDAALNARRSAQDEEAQIIGLVG